MRVRSLVPVLAALGLLACSDEEPSGGGAADSGVLGGDAGSTDPRDGGAIDGGASDGGGQRDGGRADSGLVDGGGRDGGSRDRDGGVPDGGARDGGASDGGAMDGGGNDGGLRDGGPRDAGPRDAGPRDAGGPPPVTCNEPGLVTQTITDTASSGTPDTYFIPVTPGDPFCASVTGGGSGTWGVTVSNGTSAGIYCSNTPDCRIRVPAGEMTLLVTAQTTGIGAYTLTIRSIP